MILKISHLSEVSIYLGVLCFYLVNLATLERGGTESICQRTEHMGSGAVQA